MVKTEGLAPSTPLDLRGLTSLLDFFKNLWYIKNVERVVIMRKQVEVIFCDRCEKQMYTPHILEVDGEQKEYCRSCISVITKTCATCHKHFSNAVIRDDAKQFNCFACIQNNDYQIMMNMMQSGHQFH